MKLLTCALAFCVAMCGLSLVGCAGRRDKAARPAAAVAPAPESEPARHAVFANQLAGGAAAPTRLRIVRLEVLQLVVPLGAVSRSEEFWKHVEEQRIDVGTYDLLRKNGWRLGIAPTSEWNYF